MTAAAFADLRPAHCSGAVAATVLSLPLHPALGDDEIDMVAHAVNQFAESSVRASGTR